MAKSKAPYLTRSRSKLPHTKAGPFSDAAIPTTPDPDTVRVPRDDLYVLGHNVPRSKFSPRPRTASDCHEKAQTDWVSLRVHNDLPSRQTLEVPIPKQSEIIYNRRDTDIMIGMALGSPSEIDASPRPYDSVGANCSYTTSIPGSTLTASEDVLPVSDVDDLMKQKSTRWKMFGGIFGKKSASGPSSPASPFYQLQQSPQGVDRQEDKKSQHASREDRAMDVARLARSPSTPNHRGMQSPKKKHLQKKPPREDKTRPNMTRAHTVPQLQVEEPSPPPPPKDGEEYGATLRGLDNAAPMLQVDIPCIELDRYSVMFDDVLKPKQPTLLERRQAQLGKLNTDVRVQFFSTVSGIQLLTVIKSHHSTRADGLLKPIRRATSPLLASSPSFSLFPSPSSSSRPSPTPRLPLRPSPLHRSATVPNNMSPSRANFEISRKDHSQPVFMMHSPAYSSVASSSPAPKWSADGFHPSPASTEPIYCDELLPNSYIATKSSRKLLSDHGPGFWLTNLSDKALPPRPEPTDGKLFSSCPELAPLPDQISLTRPVNSDPPATAVHLLARSLYSPPNLRVPTSTTTCSYHP